MVSPSQQPVTRTPSGEITMSTGEGVGIACLAHDEQGNVRVNIFFPDYNLQKCFTFDPDENVWDAKKMVLEEMSEQLHDPLNYGLYLPPQGGKAGKFLDEERPLDDYKLTGLVGQLEFKYKRRVYRISTLNYRKLRQLHNKSTLKHFCEIVRSNSIDRVTKFVEKGLDPNYVDQETGETPLTLATKVSRCRNLILQLVSGGAHLDFRNKKSLTAVHTAAINGNGEAIKALLELGASPNYRDSKNLTPLYHLSKRRNSPALCAELLLRDYAHIGCKDDVGNTELHQACKVGNYRVAEMLVFYGAELDYQSNTGATPLHVSAFNNELSCLQTLLVRGADKQIMNNARQTAYDVANISGNKDAANILGKHDSLLVVPFEDSPTYNINRRLAGANLEAMRLLSKSDKRINLSASVMNLANTDSLILNGSGCNRSDSMMKSELGHLGLYDSMSASRKALQRGCSMHLPNTVPGRVFICTTDYTSDSHGHLRLTKGDMVTVLTVGDDGMWEGKVDDKEGWFPSENVAEVKRNNLGPRSKSVVEDPGITRQQTYNGVFSQDISRGEGVRTVVLARTKKGFGFVLRGAKAEQLRKLNVQFVPSEKMPALQYLDSVEKGSVSDKAGLRAGDFILEIDGVDVVQASHEQTVQVIKKAGDVLAMKVVRAVLTQENGGTATAANAAMNGSATLPHRKPQKEEVQPGSTSAVLLRKTNGDALNGIATDEEKLALDFVKHEQLDATLANYDSDSRSSGSGTIPPNSVTFRDQKTASIRQRPSSSHFNSIQELDDMFAAPAVAAPAAPAVDKADARKPAESRASSDLAMGRRKSVGGMSSGTGSTEPIVVAAPLAPPPPTFPAPAAPDETRKASTSSFSSNPDTSAQSANEKVNAPNFPTLTQSNSFTQQSSTNKEPAVSSFSEAIKKAAADREADRVVQQKVSTPHMSVGNELYAVVQKRQARLDAGDSSAGTPPNAPRPAPAVSVEDQLKRAVAKRRTVIERQDTATDSDRSHSQTPERSLSPEVKDSKPEATNFRELAELKRQQFLKKKADSRDKLLPPPATPTSNSNKFSNSSTEENLSELQNVMNRLSVAKADEPNNNIKKKTPPPIAIKKSGSKTISPASLHDHLSPVEEFPPPPPPHDFGPNSADIIIPPPSFEITSQPAFGSHSLSPPAYCVDKNVPTNHHNETDNHSVTSSVGSDTISSVSQDGNRLSVATSGYSSDPNRSTKLSFSGKNVEVWTAEEVGDWLDSIGLAEYKAVFADNCIEGETLVSMTKADIKELGVEKVGHRVKLDKEIKKLAADSNA